MSEWQPIETAPFMETVLLWAPAWRSPFPGKRNSAEGHDVYVDTCEPEARGWQAWATHWRPMPKPPER